MGEVALVVSNVNNGLRERLDAEINAFNVAATGYADAGCCALQPATTAGTCAPACSGGPGVDVLTSSFSGCGRTIADPAWAPGC